MRIQYFAAARAARGTGSETIDPEALGLSTLGDLVAHLGRTHTDLRAGDQDLAAVLARCTFLADGRGAGPERSLAGIAELDVMPPFAGG